jgi:hypothetical protein
MRLSLASVAACGVSIALLTGCSAPRDSSALPSSGLNQSQAAGDSLRGKLQFPPRGTSYVGMLKWFADGKMPAPAPRPFMKRWLHDYLNRSSYHPHSARKAGTLAIWAYIGNYNWLLGVTANGRRDVYTIDVRQNNCLSGQGMKVDGSGNAWISCSEWYNGLDYWGSAEEYSNTGALLNTYKGGCPSNVSGCQAWDAFGNDVAPDGNGGVYVGDLISAPCVGSSPSGCYPQNGTGWEYFASPSSQPVYSNVYGTQPSGCSSNCTFVSQVGSFDVDRSGNVWTEYQDCQVFFPPFCGVGIAEVTGVSSGNPSFSVVVAPGVLPGTSEGGSVGIYVAGSTATVGDTFNQTVYQYALPITPSSTPSILGVTPENPQFCGSPFAGGFNASGSAFAVADLCGWVDTLHGSRARALANIGFQGVTAAGYAPSNK